MYADHWWSASSLLLQEILAGEEDIFGGNKMADSCLDPGADNKKW